MKATPITAEKLNQCLDWLAAEIDQRGLREGEKLLPLYQRFEAELEAISAQSEIMASVSARCPTP